jgi:hypothetical protein
MLQTAANAPTSWTNPVLLCSIIMGKAAGDEQGGYHFQEYVPGNPQGWRV